MTDPYRKPPEGEPLIVLGSGEPGTGNSRIFAVNLTTGVTLWETTLPTTYASGPSTMAIGDGLVVVVTGDGKVFCVDHKKPAKPSGPKKCGGETGPTRSNLSS